MSLSTTSVPDVFSTVEVARAAGVHQDAVQALVAAGQVGTVKGRYMPSGEAVRAVRMLRDGNVVPRADELFRPPAHLERSPARALAASGVLHALMLTAFAVLTTLGVASAPHESQPLRLVFLATPGPGGGGGGGGLRQPAPAPRAEVKGDAVLRSPVPPPAVIRKDPPARRTPPPAPPLRPVERPVEPPPPLARPEPMPQVVAPVAAAPADTRDVGGTVTESPKDTASQGPGSGGGAGTGRGTGLGEGDGAGIGAGSGGGTGGGPYRPGSGITPPSVQREVKPDYTEEARRRGLAGDVVLEIVVRSDGTVGDIRILQGLGSGLDQRATDAVRQWRFSPARRFGTPVDVIVEVAVEFKLR
ncbi:MAG TPA: energy transducer TonB [Vicinamibacterales bacterium]|nr:energy transducer TonB [Vicinamibacterales bacterium]